jgi:hypothetical protein
MIVNRFLAVCLAAVHTNTFIETLVAIDPSTRIVLVVRQRMEGSLLLLL